MAKKSFTHVQIFMLYFVINLEVSGALFTCFNKSTEHHFEPNWLHAMTQTQLPGHRNVNIWCSNAQQGGGGGEGERCTAGINGWIMCIPLAFH